MRLNATDPRPEQTDPKLKGSRRALLARYITALLLYQEPVLPRDTDSCRMSSVSIRHLQLNKTVCQTLTKPSGKILNSNAENRYPSATGTGNFPNTHLLQFHEAPYGCLCTVYNTAWRWQSFLKPHLGSSCRVVLLRKCHYMFHFVTHTGVHKSTQYRAW